MEERPFRIREVEGSNPSVSTFCCKGKVDDEGFEPSAFRMQNGRSTTELNARLLSPLLLRGQSPVDFGSTPLTAWVRLLLLCGGRLAQW